ncbi:Polynucleotide 5'-hydroxyl-kinase GRC3 [Hondaea fermentalgiana]|uniref:Polynucleotide 5'-hydroxyl-kinase GRC3 n=1 Tax=Hondaea fermentalgiana TaxID=2315210 RepID=A0A2R5GER4_9STRA|nr:Polynucleotide 5'-hydroxyl-kinase GRC3 [Hondaea fermentalgiana]|eukprot:GBG29430.1 Polynucleotide 5'-hydroxyl-kinase GRC3 [Hondaea fermentalgiana]
MASLWASSATTEAEVTTDAGWDRALASLTRRVAKLGAGDGKRRAGGDGDDKDSATVKGAEGEMHVGVLGAKGLGKSTFLRVAASRALDAASSDIKVFVLDTDPGQPLFELPGTLSLYEAVFENHAAVDGKPAAKKRKLAGKKRPRATNDANGQQNRSWQSCASVFLGDVSPAMHPSSYMDCIAALFRVYERRSADAPSVLFVNFQGWSLGLGAVMTAAAMQMARIGQAVHLRHMSKADAIEYDAKALDRVYRLSPAHIAGSAESAREMRFLRFASYFGAHNLADLDLKRAFSLECPREIQLASLRADESADLDLASAVEGALVSICRPFDERTCAQASLSQSADAEQQQDGEDEDDQASSDNESHVSSSTMGPRFEVIAMGYVRASQNGVLTVVSPVSKQDLVARGMTHLVLGTQGAPLARWQASDVEAVANASDRAFFADPDVGLDLVPPSGVNRKNLKRRRLANRARR